MTHRLLMSMLCPGVAHLSDGFVGDPFTLFSVGQSVTAQVLQVSTQDSCSVCNVFLKPLGLGRQHPYYTQ